MSKMVSSHGLIKDNDIDLVKDEESILICNYMVCSRVKMIRKELNISINRSFASLCAVTNGVRFVL